MNKEEFEKVITGRIAKCFDVLADKAEEYATSDRLHNFKVAAQLQGVTAIAALGGMMAKHTVSIYDLINDFESGKDVPCELWDEKIGDHINYLLLLTALIEEGEGIC